MHVIEHHDLTKLLVGAGENGACHIKIPVQRVPHQARVIIWSNVGTVTLHSVVVTVALVAAKLHFWAQSCLSITKSL